MIHYGPRDRPLCGNDSVFHSYTGFPFSAPPGPVNVVTVATKSRLGLPDSAFRHFYIKKTLTLDFAEYDHLLAFTQGNNRINVALIHLAYDFHDGKNFVGFELNVVPATSFRYRGNRAAN